MKNESEFVRLFFACISDINGLNDLNYKPERDLDRATMEKERLLKTARYQSKHEIGLNNERIRAVVESVEPGVVQLFSTSKEVNNIHVI